MRNNLVVLFLLTITFSINAQSEKKHTIEDATKMAHKFLLVDTHIDVPYRLEANWEDVSKETKGNFDYPKAIKGGLNIPFMSIYVPAKYEKGRAKDFANKMIKIVDDLITKHPEKFTSVNSVAEVNSKNDKTKVMFAMGMENGSPIESDLKNVKYFYDKGIRYITLAHSKNNHICDSSYDDEEKWNGLSPFGEKLIPEMNKIGMMVDVSHVSDKSFYNIIDITEAPVIASHSSCRKFTPDWERNMSDDMIKRLAANGGVIQINFGSSFISGKIREQNSAVWKHIREYRSAKDYNPDDEKSKEYIKNYRKENHPGFSTIGEVVDHIDHVVNLVGIDHVGLGSDYDGVGDSLPEDLKDVSQYPYLILGLLNRGYSEGDIEKICSGNILRVWKKVEETAKKLQSQSN